MDPARSKYLTAADWDSLIQSDPSKALMEASRVVAAAENAPVAALARSAVSRALFDLGRLDEAQDAARLAIEESDVEAVPDDVRSSVGLSAAVVIAESGNIDAGLAALDVLGEASSGLQLGRVKLQTAYVLHNAGRINDALVALDECDRLIGEHAEGRDRLRLHLMRGVVRLQQGRLEQAEADLVAAEELSRKTGMLGFEAQSVSNRGVLYGRARRINEAVLAFETASETFVRAGSPARTVAHMEIDRAEVMMHSGLPAEAVKAARSALALIEPSGNQVMVGDALLLLARAELAAGHARHATATARRAAELFQRTHRPDMSAHAGAIEVTARLRRVDHHANALECLADAQRVCADLRSAGWNARADEISLDCVRFARRRNCLHEARDDIERLRAGLAEGRRDTELPGHFAEAVSAEHRNDIDAAIRSCHAGLTVVDDIVEEAPTLEDRSAAVQIGGDISNLLIELAVGQGAAETAFAAAEGTRARALHHELAEREKYRPLSVDGAERLILELAEQLAGRTLVEWVVVRDDIWAVVLDDGGTRLVRVGGYREAVRARDRLMMWLDLAAADPDDPSERAMRAARLLDDLLITPLDLRPGTEVVLVPVDLLHGIPWSGLASLADRSVVLTPNAQLWLEADRRATSPAISVGMVRGPGVAASEIERDAIRLSYRGAALVDDDAATAARLAALLRDAGVVHVAAHGMFRSDHPLLSTLRLDDGDATLYDAIPDRVNAELVILSSCEGGAQGTSDGSEVLGLSAVLLARGAAAVLAPLTAVRELECAEFVAEVHRELGAGRPFAAAVAAVRARWLADDDLSRWAVASSFTCFGSGAVTVATDGDHSVLLEG